MGSTDSGFRASLVVELPLQFIPKTGLEATGLTVTGKRIDLVQWG